MTDKVQIDRELLDSIINCLNSAISFTQRDFDHPPEPDSEWDYAASQLVFDLRAALYAPQQEAVARVKRHELIVPVSEKLHPDTAELVAQFAFALAKKLREAEAKYGYSNLWKSYDWEEICQTELLKHLAKGDPRDVAAYCAFLWWHNWKTVAPAPSVPEGWQLVPKEPTWKMQDAPEVRVDAPCIGCGDTQVGHFDCAEIYKAMLSAAPNTPSADDRNDVERFFPFEFEVWQNDEMVASASGPQDTALSEAMHYATQYQQDGPVRVFEVTRTLVAAIAA